MVNFKYPNDKKQSIRLHSFLYRATNISIIHMGDNSCSNSTEIKLKNMAGKQGGKTKGRRGETGKVKVYRFKKTSWKRRVEGTIIKFY